MLNCGPENRRNLLNPPISSNSQIPARSGMSTMISSRTRHQKALLRQSSFNLPVELVEMIANCCELEDHVLLHLRLTCRDLQAKTRPLWLKTYFSTRSTALSNELLPRLGAVAQVPELAASVKSLYFLDRAELEAMLSFTSDLIEDDDLMTTAKKIAAMLSSTFRKLPNLSEFYFDYTRRKSYCGDVGNGRQRLSDVDGQPLHGYTFAAVALAAKVSHLRPEVLSGVRIGARSFAEVCPQHFCSILRLDGLFDKLTTLEVQLHNDSHMDVPNMGIEVATCLSQLPLLKALVMSSSSHYPYHEAEWIRAIAPSLSAQNLTDLKIHDLKCRWADLWTLLLKHTKTLRRFEMVGVELSDKGRLDCLRTMAKQLKEYLQLERLSVKYLSIDCEHVAIVGMGEPLTEEFFLGEDRDYVKVNLPSIVELLGSAEVQFGLSKMITNGVLIPGSPMRIQALSFWSDLANNIEAIAEQLEKHYSGCEVASAEELRSDYRSWM